MIGYYVHHHGRGHLQRLGAIAEHLHAPVTGLSSLAALPGWAGDWLVLPRDDDHIGSVLDPTAHGVLHWVPRHHEGLRARMALVASWVEQVRPKLLVVDVSVEVTLLARLMGVPIAVMAMFGDRTDTAHRLAYDVADGLLAPWPADLSPSQWPRSWQEKATHLGAFSRFDDRARRAAGSGAGERNVLVLWGSGGNDVTAAQRDAARSATPGWRWTYRLGRDEDDGSIWDDLLDADVVVVHGGHNAVAEVAAARRPAVVIAQTRPFDEQLHRARCLQQAGIATGLDRWPAAGEWPRLLDEASGRGGEGWARWSPGDGAQQAARAIEHLAHAEPLPDREQP